jgi:hypothetical protein
MTDRPKPRRLSRWALRALAWVAGGLAFLTPFAGLTISPKPATAEPGANEQGRQLIIVRQITRRLIVRPAPERKPVQYVYVGGGSPGGSSGSSAPSRAGGGGSTVAAPAPTTSTGGS